MNYSTKIFKGLFFAFICVCGTVLGYPALAIEDIIVTANSYTAGAISQDQLYFVTLENTSAVNDYKISNLYNNFMPIRGVIYNGMAYWQRAFIIGGDCYYADAPTSTLLIELSAGMTCDLMTNNIQVYNDQAGTFPWVSTSTHDVVTKYDIDTATHSNLFENNPPLISSIQGFKNNDFGPGAQFWAVEPQLNIFPLGSASNPEVPLAYSPTISPVFPPDGINTTTTDMTSWNATGTIMINPLDVNIWYLLHISLIPIDEYGISGITSYYGSYALDLSAGENASYTIPATDFKTSGGASLPSGVYQVTYTMIGKTPTLGNVQYIFSPPGTIIRDQDMPVFSTSTIPASFEIVTLEDCSALGLPDKWFCEIKNAMIGIFAPTGAKIAEFKNTIGEINNRFPINYIKSAQARWQGVYNDISSTSTPLTLTILGNNGTINFNVFDSSGLKTILQSFFGLIFISIFIFWAVKFIQRIF